MERNHLAREREGDQRTIGRKRKKTGTRKLTMREAKKRRRLKRGGAYVAARVKKV